MLSRLALLLLCGAVLAAGQTPRPGAEELFRRGQELAGRHRYAEAILAFEQALRLQPDQPNVLFALGSAAFQYDDHPRAAEVYQRLLTLDPGHVSAHHNLAAVYVAMERFDQAQAELAEAVRRDPTYVLAHDRLGQLHFRKGEYNWPPPRTSAPWTWIPPGPTPGTTWARPARNCCRTEQRWQPTAAAWTWTPPLPRPPPAWARRSAARSVTPRPSPRSKGPCASTLY